MDTASRKIRCRQYVVKQPMGRATTFLPYWIFALFVFGRILEAHSFLNSSNQDSVGNNPAGLHCFSHKCKKIDQNPNLPSGVQEEAIAGAISPIPSRASELMVRTCMEIENAAMAFEQGDRIADDPFGS